MNSDHDPIYRADCPSRAILDQIADKWSMLVLMVLHGKTLGVEYALTPLGQSLKLPFNALYDWTVENMDTIQVCQSRYDQSDDAIRTDTTQQSGITLK